MKFGKQAFPKEESEFAAELRWRNAPRRFNKKRAANSNSFFIKKDKEIKYINVLFITYLPG